MEEFLKKLGLRYSRSGMPGPKALNGPQVDKIWRNLDLLYEMLMERGDGVIADGSVDYLRKLEALYLMCARYLLFCPHTNSSIYFPANHSLVTIRGSSRSSEMPSIICIVWGFFRKPQKYISSIVIWSNTWISRPGTTLGPWHWQIVRAWRRVILA